MKIVADTDILGTFARIRRLDIPSRRAGAGRFRTGYLVIFD